MGRGLMIGLGLTLLFSKTIH